MIGNRTVHEPSIRAPLVVRYLGLAPRSRRRVVRQMVLNMDIAPSILDLRDARPLTDLHGRSWKHRAQADTVPWRTSWFYEYK